MASSSFPLPEISPGHRIAPSPLVAELGFDGPNGGFMLVSQRSHRHWHICGGVAECLYGNVLKAEEVVRSPYSGMWSSEGQGGFAIKQMSLATISSMQGQANEDPLKEVSALQYLKGVGPHPNIIEVTEVLQDAEYLYVISPFCLGGELFRVVKNTGGGLPEAYAKSVFRDILEGLAFLHNLGICHRDMSLENILLTDGGRAKIIDFGMALMLRQQPHGGHRGGGGSSFSPTGPCGKRRYMAPEVAMNENTIDGFAVDAWACGVILFILLAGRPPFEVPIPTQDQLCTIIAVHGGLQHLIHARQIPISAEAAQLIQGCLMLDPRRRATVQDMLMHPWLSS